MKHQTEQTTQPYPFANKEEEAYYINRGQACMFIQMFTSLRIKHNQILEEEAAKVLKAVIDFNEHKDEEILTLKIFAVTQGISYRFNGGPLDYYKLSATAERMRKATYEEYE